MLSWYDSAWAEYLYWQDQDRKTLKRINRLLKDIQRNPYDGLGDPEPLKGDLAGFWSRRIDDYNRLVYWIGDDTCKIIQCRGHYDTLH